VILLPKKAFVGGFLKLGFFSVLITYISQFNTLQGSARQDKARDGKPRHGKTREGKTR
jgi:hypothetical protein